MMFMRQLDIWTLRLLGDIKGLLMFCSTNGVMAMFHNNPFILEIQCEMFRSEMIGYLEFDSH